MSALCRSPTWIAANFYITGVKGSGVTLGAFYFFKEFTPGSFLIKSLGRDSEVVAHQEERIYWSWRFWNLNFKALTHIASTEKKFLTQKELHLEICFLKYKYG